MHIGRIVLTTFSVFLFLALCIYLLLCVLDSAHELHKSHGKISATFMVFVWIGLAFCFYQGAHALLFWWPYVWGHHSEDSRMSLAVLFAFLMSIGFLELVEKGVACKRDHHSPDRFPPDWFGMATRSAPWSKSNKMPGEP
jgi:hypothetical protein